MEVGFFAGGGPLRWRSFLGGGGSLACGRAVGHDASLGEQRLLQGRCELGLGPPVDGLEIEGLRGQDSVLKYTPAIEYTLNR